MFGTPGPSTPWGWRVEGHHLSLNFTLVPGRPVAMTPAFLGANPAQVPSGPQRGLRALAGEQDLARALIQNLTTAQRARTVIAADSLGDIVSGPSRTESLAAPAGLALADMTAEQRAQALRLVEEYARNMRAELAEQELSRMRRADVALIHFAWAGPIEAGKRALLPSARADAAHRVRQHAEQRQPHPFGVARSGARLRSRISSAPTTSTGTITITPSRGGSDRGPARVRFTAKKLPSAGRPGGFSATVAHHAGVAPRLRSLVPVPDPARSVKPLVVLAGLAAGVAALYLARGVLIPVALAILLTFLVHPVVARLARLGLGRALSVGLVVTMLFATLGVVAWGSPRSWPALDRHPRLPRQPHRQDRARPAHGPRRGDREGAERGDRGRQGAPEGHHRAAAPARERRPRSWSAQGGAASGSFPRCSRAWARPRPSSSS